MNKSVKNWMTGIFEKLLDQPKSRARLGTLIREYSVVDFDDVKGALLTGPNTIYDDLPESPNRDRLDISPVFVTARFRSGSTFLWQLFRSIDQLHCYYEPLNERRWFDPLDRGDHVDETHAGVEEYWREYEHLEGVSGFFRDDWSFRHLYMDASDTDMKLRAYLDALIVQAPRRPLLQFNRVDFRLPWLKANYPSAKIVHLYRHPRDQWLSSIKYKRAGEPVKESGFYTRPWLECLSRKFSILNCGNEKHPYYSYYLLWRLSYLYGVTHSDISISYESLISDTQKVFSDVLATVECDPAYQPISSSLVRGVKSKWRDFADASWFEDIETDAEQCLASFLS